MAAFAVACTALAVSVGHYFSVPFLLLYVGGYGLLGVQGMRDAWLGWRAHPRVGKSPAMADSKVES